MMKRLIYLLLVFWFVFFSCSDKEKNLRMVKVTEYSSLKVSDTALIKLIKNKTGLDINIDYTLSEDLALKMIENDEVDLIILPNNVKSSSPNLRVVVPLLPRFLMILTNKKVDSLSAKELFETGKVYFEDRSRLDSLIFKSMYFNFDIDETKINTFLSEDITLEPTDSLKVYVGLTHTGN